MEKHVAFFANRDAETARRESKRMQWLIGMRIGGVLVTAAVLGSFIRLSIWQTAKFTPRCGQRYRVESEGWTLEYELHDEKTHFLIRAIRGFLRAKCWNIVAKLALRRSNAFFRPGVGAATTLEPRETWFRAMVRAGDTSA